MDKQQYHNRVSKINNFLTTNKLGKLLFQMILNKAESDSDCMSLFKKWLKKGRTVHLRDELSLVFLNRFNGELEWYYAFTVVDDAFLQVKYNK
jgi:hypothetical protein